MKNSKSKKVSKATKKFNIKRIAIIGVVAVVLLGVSYIAFWQYIYLRSVVRQAEIVTIREQIINAVDALRTDAPIEPRTGDVYFPQAKLYIPATQSPRDFSYYYHPKDIYSDQDELNITDESTTEQSRSMLYTAQNYEEFLARVPRYQACSRGVRLAYNKISDNPDLKITKEVMLENGRTLFMYTEPTCDESGDLVNILSTIKPYQ